MEPWEKYSNNDAAAADAGPWTKFDNQPDNYLPDTAALRKGFAGDPLSVFAPAERARLESMFSTYENPQDEAKKHVMAQYLAPRVNMPPEAVLNNFQTVADTYFKQKNISIEKAYQGIGKLLNPEPDLSRSLGPSAASGINNLPPMEGGEENGAMAARKTYDMALAANPGRLSARGLMDAAINPKIDKTFGGQMVNHLVSGTSNILTGTAAYPDMLARQVTDVANYPYNALVTWGLNKPEWQLWYNESVMGTQRNPLKATADAAGMLQNAVENSLYKENIQGELLDNLKAGNYENSGKIVAYGIAENIPQFALLALTNNPALLGAKMQGLSEAQKLEKMSDFGLLLMGASQAGSQRMQYNDQPGDSATKDFAATFTGLFEAQTEKVFALPILKKFFENNPEGKGKFMKSMVEAMTDYLKAGTGEAVSQFGQNVTERSTGLGSQPWYSGMLESFVIGAILEGSPAAVNLYRAVTSAPQMSFHEYDQVQTESQKASTARMKELLALPPEQLSWAELDELRDHVRTLDGDNAADNFFRSVAEPMGFTPEEVDALIAKDHLQRKNAGVTGPLPPGYNPREASMNAITEALQPFHNLPDVQILQSPDELPEHLLNRGGNAVDKSMVRGAWDGDTLYFVADNIQPSQAAAVVLHEVVGHHGLRGTLQGALDNTLRQVWNAKAADIQAMFADSNYQFDFANPKEQLEAAEEYIANIAQKDKKPTWFGKVRAAVRGGLRKIMPNMRMSDTEIDALIARSRKYANTGLTTDGSNPDIRFNLADRSLDMSTLPDTLDEVVNITSSSYLTHMPEHKAAKDEGDDKAAQAIARRLINSDQGREAVNELYRKLDMSRPVIFVPVIKDEVAGNLNMLPHAYAHALKNIFGGTVCTDVIKTGGSPNTRKSVKERVNKVIPFDGLPSDKTAQIVMVDDVYTTGSTMRAPVEYLTENGFDVVAIASMAVARYTRGFKNQQSTLDKLKKAIRIDTEPIKGIDDNELRKLTNAEIAAVLNTRGDNRKTFISRYVTPEIQGSIGPDGSQRQSGQLSISETGGHSQAVIDPSTGISNQDFRFSLKSDLTAEDITMYGRAIQLDTKSGKVKTAAQVMQLYPELTEEQAKAALKTAREINADNNRKVKERKKADWMRETYPLLAAVEEKFPNGIKPDPKFGNKDSIDGSYINWKDGTPSDEAARYLDVDEQILIDEIAGVRKRDIGQQYENLFSKRAEKERVQSELMNITAAESAEYRKVITDYARKNLPAENAKAVFKYLEKDTVTMDDVMQALAEIDKHPPSTGERLKLKHEISKLKKDYFKLQKEMIDTKVSLDEKMHAIKDFALNNLPDDITKGELRMLLNRFTQLLGASDTVKNRRRVKLTDEFGNPIRDAQTGEPSYQVKTGEDGKPLYKNGKPVYVWETDHSIKSQREKIVASAFEVVTKAAERSERDVMLEHVKNIFEKTQIKKDLKGRPTGKLSPEIQIKVDQLRIISEMPPSEVAERLEKLGETLMNEPDNDALVEQFADLSHFSNLKSKTLAEISETYENLSALVNDGRTLYQEEMRRQAAKREMDRLEMTNEVTGGKGMMSPEEARKARENRSAWLDQLRTYHRKGLSWEWLLNNITRLNTADGTLKARMVRELSLSVHRATQAEETANRRTHDELNKALETIFDAKGGKLIKVLAQWGEMVEKSGVFRMHGRTYKSISIPVNEYAESLVKMREDPNPPAEKLERIARGEEALRRARLDNKRVVTEKMVLDEGKPVEVPMSRDEALNYWMLWQQNDTRENMMLHGWTDKTMQELEKFIGKPGLEFGRWMQQSYANEYDSINAVFRDIFHVNMPQIHNYAPARYDVNTARTDSGMIDAPKGMSGVNPGSLISRKQHGMAPKQVGAIQMFAEHSVQMEHFKTWSAVVKQLRGIFNGEEVRKSIQQYYGDEAYRIITEKINQFADGGNRKKESLRLIDALRKGFTVSKLAYNTGVLVKQLTGLPAFAMDIPMSSFVKYEAKFWSNPAKHWMELVNGSEFVRNRWGAGFNRDMALVLRDCKDSRSFLSRAIEAGMSFGKAGDMIPVIVGGYAVYQYNYDKLIRDGASPDQAHSAAMTEFEMAAERSQQAGHVKDLGIYQSGGSLARLMTMFIQSPQQYYNHTAESLFDAFAGKPGAAPEAAKKVFLAWVVMPMLFQTATDLFSKGINFDDWDWKDYLRSVLIGPLNGLFIVGRFLDEIGDALLMGEARASDSTTLFSDKAKILWAAAKFHKWAEKGEFEIADLLPVADLLAEGASSAFAPATAYSVIRREYRRIVNWFGDGDKKKKHHDSGIL